MPDDSCQMMCKRTLKKHTCDDGLADSLHILSKTFNQTNVVMTQLPRNTYVCD